MKFQEQLNISRQKVSHSSNLKDSGKYTISSSGYTPTPYPGITVLALPYPIRSTPLFNFLKKTQSGFANSPVFASVPEQSFHITLADLAHGDYYKNNKQEQLQIAVEQVFANNKLKRPIQCKLLGIGHFGSVIAGIVVCENEQEFEKVSSLRSALYAHPKLNEYTPTLPFILHITLGYFCSPKDGSLTDSEENITDLLNHYNKQVAQLDDTTIKLTGFGLFDFTDMESYSNKTYAHFNLVSDEI